MMVKKLSNYIKARVKHFKLKYEKKITIGLAKESREIVLWLKKLCYFKIKDSYLYKSLGLIFNLTLELLITLAFHTIYNFLLITAHIFYKIIGRIP